MKYRTSEWLMDGIHLGLYLGSRPHSSWNRDRGRPLQLELLAVSRFDTLNVECELPLHLESDSKPVYIARTR